MPAIAPDSNRSARNNGVSRRVLYIDHTAELGGGEIALRNLVRALDRERVNPTVLLFATGPLEEQLRNLGTMVHVMPLSASVLQTRKDSLGAASLLKVKEVAAVMLAVVRVARFIVQHQIEIVHTNSLKSDLIGGLAGRLAGRPVVWHLRDRIAADYLPPAVVKAFRLLSRIVPSYVIANSQATLQTLRLSSGRHGMSIPSGIDLPKTATGGPNVSIVHDGLDGQTTRTSPRPSHRTLRIGLVGRISRWKGQHIFLQAAAEVRKQFPQSHFQIIGAPLFGEEDYYKELLAMTEQLGLKDAVEFTGFRTDVREMISNLEVLVHASISGEPFGQVVIEGMAAGKPVVATRGGGIPEIVEEGKTGLLVPMGDADAMAQAICQLLADPAAAAELGRRGRQRVLDHFTIDQAARKVERVYDLLLSGESRRGTQWS